MIRVSSEAITFVCIIIIINVIGGSRGRAQALQLHNASEDLVPQPPSHAGVWASRQQRLGNEDGVHRENERWVLAPSLNEKLSVVVNRSVTDIADLNLATAGAQT
jgi:hypothetical protein